MAVGVVGILVGCSTPSGRVAATPEFSAAGQPRLLATPQAGNAYGFEGGEVVHATTGYWWFTTELTGAPYWGETTLALWTSADGQQWRRHATLLGPSSADQSGADRRAALWSPMPVFDRRSRRWRVFYIAYRSNASMVNYDGEVWESTSTVPGVDGIAGPYRNDGVVLSEQMGTPQSWEGAQGDDSFEPYQLPSGEWEALYGSSDARSVWRVGLATARDIDGPWTRVPGNPLAISATIENPVVERIDGRYIAVYDDVAQGLRAGCMFSGDGTTWEKCPEIRAHDGVRTPLGLVDVRSRPAHSPSELLLFYTACSERICNLFSEIAG
jgi:hypothetical protein